MTATPGKFNGLGGGDVANISKGDQLPKVPDFKWTPTMNHMELTEFGSSKSFYLKSGNHKLQHTLLHSEICSWYDDGYGQVIPLNQVTVGSIYAAACTQQQYWARVLVKEIYPEFKKVKVAQIDHGLSSMIVARDMRVLKAELWAHPRLAMECCLDRVQELLPDKRGQVEEKLSTQVGDGFSIVVNCVQDGVLHLDSMKNLKYRRQ